MKKNTTTEILKRLWLRTKAVKGTDKPNHIRVSPGGTGYKWREIENLRKRGLIIVEEDCLKRLNIAPTLKFNQFIERVDLSKIDTKRKSKNDRPCCPVCNSQYSGAMPLIYAGQMKFNCRVCFSAFSVAVSLKFSNFQILEV